MKKIRYIVILWTSINLLNAQEPILVKDIFPGDGYGMETEKFSGAALGETLIFEARSGTLGNELWLTDGTADGTHLLKDLNTGVEGSYPSNFVNYNNKVYFTAGGFYDGVLYETDGTPAGTHILIPNIRCNYASGGTFRFLDDKIFIHGYNGEAEGLFVSDGTGGEIGLLKESHHISTFVPLNDKIYFSIYDPENQGLWVTDGTPEGTQLIKEGVILEEYGTLVYDNKIYFTYSDGVHGLEPWVTDGTPDGTFMIKDTYPGTNTGASDIFVTYNGEIYFRGGENSSLWKTDGTETGTMEVDPNFTTPKCVYNGKLITWHEEEDSGFELYAFDGSGFELIKDINPDGNSELFNFLVFNGLVYFIGSEDDVFDDFQLWLTDGTESGTFKIQPGSSTEENSIYPIIRLITVGNNLYFPALYYSAFGRELYKLETTPLSVEDMENSQKVKVYPNPVKDILNIAFEKDGNYAYSLYSLTGQTVKSGEFDRKTNQLTVSGLPKGVYVLKITDKSGKSVSTHKIMVK